MADCKDIGYQTGAGNDDTTVSGNLSHVMRIEFERKYPEGLNRPPQKYIALFDDRQISEEEVAAYLDVSDFIPHAKVVIISRQQWENVFCNGESLPYGG